MASSTIKIGLAPYEGEYEWGIEEQVFSTLEWRWIKQIAGYYPLTLNEGIQRGDIDLIVAFGVIALYRAGRIQKNEALQVAELFDDPPFDGVAISMIGGDEPDKNPTQESPQLLGNDFEPGKNDAPESSGNSSNVSSAPSESLPSPTGDPILGTLTSEPDSPLMTSLP